MEHPGEVWQEFDGNGERLGGLVPEECYKTGYIATGGAAIVLYRFIGEKIQFLFQHRSDKLFMNPGKWDVSAGGHINLDETLIEAVTRETYEEIGATIEKDKLEFAYFAASSPSGKNLIALYFYDWTDRADDFSFNDNEVAEVAWIDADKLEEFWPKFKPQIREDLYFKVALQEWTSRINVKYGNH